MALPLPKVVSDVGPGGPLITSLGGINALNDAMQQTKYNAVKAQYAPQTLSAEAASKLAYANLMGPQFLAKLMGNSDVVANSPQLQDPATLQKLYQAGMGGGTGNALMNMPGNQQPSGLGNFVNTIKNAFGLGGQPSSQQPAPNAMLQNPTQANSDNAPYPGPASQPTPGETYRQQQNQGTVVPGTGASSGYAYDANGRNIVASPEEINAAANGNAGEKPTYAENAARFGDIKEEGKELGKERGKAISDLGKQYAQDVEAMAPLQNLMKISQSPEFMNMRKDIPFFQGLQLSTLSKIGNPAEQKAIGDYIVNTRSAIANTVNSFQGRAMAKEFDFANTMKVSDDDTLGVMQGKLEALTSLKQATMQRNEIARNLMESKHMNEGDAYAQANKQVDMDSIRKNIARQLPTPIRIRNKKTGESKLVTPAEYNELLGNT